MMSRKFYASAYECYKYIYIYIYMSVFIYSKLQKYSYCRSYRFQIIDIRVKKSNLISMAMHNVQVKFSVSVSLTKK